MMLVYEIHFYDTKILSTCHIVTVKSAIKINITALKYIGNKTYFEEAAQLWIVIFF